MHEHAKDLTYQECMEIIEAQNNKPEKAAKRRFANKTESDN
jgi:hypothetical protein